MPRVSKAKKTRALRAYRCQEIMRSRRKQSNGNNSTSSSKLPEPTQPPSSNQDQELQNEDIHLVIEAESTPPKSKGVIAGRRIVHLSYFYEQLQSISNHGPLGCNLSHMNIIGEKQIGLITKITVKCQMCNLKFYISNEPPDDMDINRRAVAGTISIGCGHSQLQELSAALDLPLISADIYQRCHSNLSSNWEKAALDAMNAAAEAERKMAVAEGRVDENNIPIIDVIVDGCWSKRTYKKNYSALSGAATIIGKKTGQILFLGVKNKYCCICAKAETKGQDPKEHICYKNYSGSSTSMESAIIVEGFKFSIEMHNLIYGRMISDGDSSTYSKLLQSRPYPQLTVQKIECRNHILRNLCNKINNLKTDTKYPLRFRKFISQKRIMVIRKLIRKAITQYTSDSESEKKSNVEFLYNDIQLVHLHAFGDHSRCKTYFCSKESCPEDVTDHDFFTSSLWSRICLLLSNVAAHSPSLIHNVDSNAVERYNSIVAKLVGGKRINFSLKGSYQTRCNAAVVSYNTHKVLSTVYKNIVGRSPKCKIRLLEESRSKKKALAAKYSRKRRRIFTKGTQDLDYGEKCQKPDMLPEIYELQKNNFLESLKKT